MMYAGRSGSRRHLPIAFAFAILVLGPARAPHAQDGIPPPTIDPSGEPGAFAGIWTYRSYVNDPNIAVTPNEILFGRAEMKLEETPAGAISGSIGSGAPAGWSLKLDGTANYGEDATTFKVQGRGEVDGEIWVYDYFGYLVPKWSNGVDQRPAIVGAVVRTAPHSGGQATPGFVGSFIAVKRD